MNGGIGLHRQCGMITSKSARRGGLAWKIQIMTMKWNLNQMMTHKCIVFETYMIVNTCSYKKDIRNNIQQYPCICKRPSAKYNHSLSNMSAIQLRLSSSFTSLVYVCAMTASFMKSMTNFLCSATLRLSSRVCNKSSASSCTPACGSTGWVTDLSKMSVTQFMVPCMP